MTMKRPGGSAQLRPLGRAGWPLLPLPSFTTVRLLGSVIPRIFIDATDAIVDAIPSPGEGEVLRHHPFREMLTDYQA